MRLPTVSSVTLTVGAQQLAKHEAIVARITAIELEELAGDTICFDKTGTLSASLPLTETLLKPMDTIHASVVVALGDVSKACAGIKLLDFKPFDNCTKFTYRDESSGKNFALATSQKSHKTNSRPMLKDTLPAVSGPLQLHTKSSKVTITKRKETTIDDALALRVELSVSKSRWLPVDQLTIAKETGGHLGLGDHIYPVKILEDGPTPGGKHASLDKIIMNADGFAGVFPEYTHEIVKHLQGLGHWHLCAIAGDGANDVPALSRTTVGIAVEGATDAARGAADIILTEPDLQLLNYSIYAYVCPLKNPA
ncbi:hypothetical protein EV361DRAFT_982279 [Lentinula raphanica]|nr:hypothetical protein EV361DRAFT_982279 [Lentinula raphanica]